MLSFFDILGLPKSFALDEKALEKSYFDAQREVHPDRLIGKNDKERGEAIARSQLVNDAYDTLKNPLSRAGHLLELEGIDISDEENRHVPPPLLMEMMELRERIQDAGDDGRELLNLTEELKKTAQASVKDLARLFEGHQYEAAAAETTRLSYLGKALEEAYMLLYRYKAKSHS